MAKFKVCYDETWHYEEIIEANDSHQAEEIFLKRLEDEEVSEPKNNDNQLYSEEVREK